MIKVRRRLIGWTARDLRYHDHWRLTRERACRAARRGNERREKLDASWKDC